MKMYQIRYRKDEWVSVLAGFADEVNINDLDHERLATRVAIDESLSRYETLDSYLVAELSVEVDELGEGKPDVVISADESVMSIDDYEELKFAHLNEDLKANPNQSIK